MEPINNYEKMPRFAGLANSPCIPYVIIVVYGLSEMLNLKKFSLYFFGGLKYVGHSFAYVAHFVFFM